MRQVLLGIILLVGSSAWADPYKGKLSSLSSDEIMTRIEQWTDAIERMDEKEKPGRRAKLLDETGLTPSDIGEWQARACAKAQQKPKRCR